MKTIKLLVLAGLAMGTANAATVTVSAGFGATNGLLVTLSGAATPYHIAIGTWNGVTSTFTQFGEGIQKASGVVANGDFVATGPASVNGGIIHLFVNPGNSVNAAGPYAVFRTATSTAFPADVSSVLGSAVATFSNFTTSVDVAGVDYEKSGTRTINFIPEPSAALLGALGALGLLRRRRI